MGFRISTYSDKGIHKLEFNMSLLITLIMKGFGKMMEEKRGKLSLFSLVGSKGIEGY